MSKKNTTRHTDEVAVNQLWDDDVIVLSNGDNAFIKKVVSRYEPITVDHYVNIITLEVADGPNKGYTITRTYMDTDVISIEPRAFFNKETFKKLRMWWSGKKAKD